MNHKTRLQQIIDAAQILPVIQAWEKIYDLNWETFVWHRARSSKRPDPVDLGDRPTLQDDHFADFFELAKGSPTLPVPRHEWQDLAEEAVPILSRFAVILLTMNENDLPDVRKGQRLDYAALVPGYAAFRVKQLARWKALSEHPDYKDMYSDPKGYL
jgi:hypothetical protein